MTNTAQAAPAANPRSATTLAILLAMAMFVLVIDTSLMNVSISAIVHDLNTTVSSVQSAIALEALVSAAFILTGSKIGDIIGRKLAYVLGLMGYAIGAAAMVLAQNLTLIVICWAIIGGLGAALLLPAMQSLIQGNFEGDAKKRAYALVGAATGIAAAIGPLLGGFITTFFSWRVGFLLEFLIIVVVLLNIRRIKDVPFTGQKHIDWVGAALSAVGMGGIVLGILAWESGGGAVGLLVAIGALGMVLLGVWLVRRKKQGKPTLLDPELFSFKHFRAGISGQSLQNIALGGMMIALPIYFQMVFEYSALQTGLSIAPMSISIFILSIAAGRWAGKRRPSRIILAGFVVLVLGVALQIPLVPRADSGLAFLIPLAITGSGLGLLVSQLNNYTLSPINEERVSEAAGVNSAAGSFGLSFGLALAGAVMLATLAVSFNTLAKDSKILSPQQQQQVAVALNEDAEIMSNTLLREQMAGQPPAVQAEMLRINAEARHVALQAALLVPLLAGLLGLLVSLRMVRLPDLEPSQAAEGLLMG